MAINDIMERIAAYECRLIEITGGEPLLQGETPRLILELLESGYEVMMETNGSIDINTIDKRCIIIIDVKCPTSGESDKNNLKNLQSLNPKDQIKFVIGNRADYEYAKDIVKTYCSGFPMTQILFSPVWGKMLPDKLAKWILDDHLDIRLHLQIHKIIWPNEQKGV